MSLFDIVLENYNCFLSVVRESDIKKTKETEEETYSRLFAAAFDKNVDEAKTEVSYRSLNLFCDVYLKKGNEELFLEVKMLRYKSGNKINSSSNSGRILKDLFKLQMLGNLSKDAIKCQLLIYPEEHVSFYDNKNIFIKSLLEGKDFILHQKEMILPGNNLYRKLEDMTSCPNKQQEIIERIKKFETIKLINNYSVHKIIDLDSRKYNLYLIKHGEFSEK